MRILQVSSARKLGGGETHVLELSAELRARGHNVVLAGRPDGPLQADIRLPFLNALDLYTAFKLRAILKKEAFDILHAHVARDYSLVLLAAWGIPKLKVILTRHLLYPVSVHTLYQRVDGWLAPTPQILASLEPLAPRTSAVIPNWVNASKFAFRPRPLGEPVTVGLLGQISPHKGHDDAIEAMRELGEGYRLLVAGAGEESYVAKLREKAAGLPVEFAGFVSLPDFFERIDILIVPSWEEPFGIVLLEGMASGVPVIATNRGGPREIIRHGMDGFLIEPRNPQAIASAIRELTQDNELRERIVRQARRHIEGAYDISMVVPKIEDFYRKVIFGSV